VDEADGYALVVKAGTNISRYGEVIKTSGSDFIEKDLFDEYSRGRVEQGDILLASTGDGTLGKCGVYRLDIPAVADGHVTIIRVDQSAIWPEYVADYLRAGFGARQIERFYTGSTGLIELSPEQAKRILIDIPASLEEQKERSLGLRQAEKDFEGALLQAQTSLNEARHQFVKA
jgi:type I restriction enzyme M protein